MPRKANKPNLPTTAAVIYARYSSHSQREESIEQQVEECTSFAKANNLKVVEIYADKAISGKTDRRTAFLRMMRDAEKGKFSVVIAYKSNRIARNMLNALQYEAKLDQYGIKTMYAKEEFGNTAAGRFALRTMMNVNQFYSENMAEDIRRGMMDNAANCKVNGKTPLGYMRGEDGRYAIHENEAEIVREIFRRVMEGDTFAEIANDLNGRGIKTKSGNLWNKGSFHRMLVNENYIGVYKYAEVRVENGIPPIIEKAVFAAVQEKLHTKKNPRGRVRNDSEYLLTGKLFCGECGGYMVGTAGTSNTGALHYYYACQNRRLEHTCKKKNVRRDWLEQKIAELTKDIVLKDDVIDWIADNAVKFQQKAMNSPDMKLLTQQLEDERKAQKNLLKAIEAGIITTTTKDRLLELETEISQLERAVALADVRSKPIEKSRIVFALEELKKGEVIDKEYQKHLIDTFVKAVYLWDDKIRIDYYYAGKNNSMTIPIKGDVKEPNGDSPRSSYMFTSGPPCKKHCFGSAFCNEAAPCGANEGMKSLC